MDVEEIFLEIKSYGPRFLHRIKRFQFGGKAQLAFLEDFAHLVNDGIPPNRAIEMLARASRGITRDVSQSIADRISEGQPLAEGMRDWFSINVVEIVRIGEQSGALGETVKSAINMMSQSASTMGAFVGAIAYPLTVIFVASAVMIYLNNSVFLQFKTIKPIEQWPSAGRQFVAIAHFIESWWWIVLLSLLSFTLVIRRIFSNYVGPLRPILDKFFPFTIYKRFVAAHVMETMGLLVANGVVFKSAIKVMQYQATPYLTSHLVTMEHLMGAGKGNIADVLDSGLIEEEDLMRLRIMAEVKGFEHGLVRLGIRGNQKGVQTLAMIAKMLGGILMLVGGGLILVVIRGIYLTGMSMGSQ